MAFIICDTDSELWYEKANEFDVKVIRMPYVVDGEEYSADLGETFDPKAFFGKMRAGAKASTAALNENDYFEFLSPIFEEAAQKHEDILYIAFSSKMSGTFEYLDVALNRLKSDYPTVRFVRYDTLNICLGTGMLVYLGAKYCREHGDDIDATCKYLDSLVNRVALYFVVEDMKYLARGGRISPAKAKIGNLMNIKPVLTVKDGKIDVGSKQNGLKKAYNYIVDAFDAEYDKDFDAPVAIVEADNAAAADDLERRIREKHPEVKEVWRQPVGPVIGVHAGPGTVGIIYIKK